MRLLNFSTLYPSSVAPGHGVFVEQRLRHLAATGQAELRVVAPVPWFPFGHPLFGQYARYARVPHQEQRHGLQVSHPRYLTIPRIGMSAAPLLLAAAARPALGRLRKQGYDFDLIDAHYFYPDGVAAVLLGQWFNRPVVITARGTDINFIPQYRLPRHLIRWAAARAAGIITVCQALKDTLVELAVPAAKITVLRNGVDTRLFHPVDREAVRARLGLAGTVLLSVGYLIERKGHDIIIRALPELPQARLLIAGEGPEERALRALAQSLGVEGRVTFLGAIPQDELKNYYSAADILVLASSREGWANVLLEAMACGTPVVATNVWGAPEIVQTPAAGILMEARTPPALVRAVQGLLAHYPDRQATRRYAEQFSWDDTTEGQLALFRDILARKEQR